MRKLFFLTAAFAISLLTLNSCSNNKPETQEADEFSDTAALSNPKDSATREKQEMLDFKFFYTLANLPSPIEMINAIYNNNVPFNRDLLNNPDNASSYSSGFKKAVNYGIYGIDMAYAAFYGQNQDILNYYSSTKRMAEKLSVQETFDKFTTDFRANADIKDSLVKIIDRAYAETDNYLRSNHRVEVASHVLAGSIIEAQFLSIELMKNAERTSANKEIFEKIYNQKLYIDNLISLFKDLQKYPNSAAFLTQLEGIKAAFNEIKSPDELNSESLKTLSGVVAAVRNDLIK
jgi:hypothetical protein